MEGLWQSAVCSREASARVLWANIQAQTGLMMAQRIWKLLCILALSNSTAVWDKVDKSSDYLTQFSLRESGSAGIIRPAACLLTQTSETPGSLGSRRVHQTSDNTMEKSCSGSLLQDNFLLLRPSWNCRP